MKIRSYIPEDFFFDGKFANGSRIFKEDLAIINTVRGNEIIASRGFTPSHGISLEQAVSLMPEDVQKLKRFCNNANDGEILILPCAGGCIFLFSYFLRTTGMLLAVRMKESEDAVRKAMQSFTEPKPILRDLEEEPPTPPLHETLMELSYYTSHFVYSYQAKNLWSHLRLIANFVGCRLDSTSFSSAESYLTRGEFDRLSVFLFCVFLILRQGDGRNEATVLDTVESGSKTSCTDVAAALDGEPTYSLRIRHIPYVRIAYPARFLKIDDAQTPTRLEALLNLACFSHFDTFEEEGELIIEASMPLNRFSATPATLHPESLRIAIGGIPRELLNLLLTSYKNFVGKID